MPLNITIYVTMYCYTIATEQGFLEVTLWTCIQEMVGSSLGQGIYSD
jgi:hypothetical protein